MKSSPLTNGTEPASKGTQKYVQYQLISKLTKNVENLVSKNGIIDSSTTQTSADLNKLLQYLIDDDSNIGRYSWKVLYGLVKNDLVCPKHLLNLCVIQSALGKPVRSLVDLVLRILPVQSKQEEDISCVEHPLSRILVNQTGSADVFNTISTYLIMCSEKDLKESKEPGSLDQAVTILEPFIRFIFFHSMHSDTFLDCVLDTSSIIIPNFPSEISHLLNIILSVLSDQKFLKKQGGELLGIIKKLGIWFLSHKYNFRGCDLKWNIVSLLLTIVWLGIDFEFNDVYPTLVIARMLLQWDEETTSVSGIKFLKEELVFLCAMLLLKCDEHCAVPLTEMILLLIPNCVEKLHTGRVNALLSILLLPTMQLLYENSLSQMNTNCLFSDLGENIITNLEACLAIKVNIPSDSPTKDKVDRIDSYSEILNVARTSLSILQYLITDKDAAIAWCDDISKTVELKSFVVKENILLQLSALLVCNYDIIVFKKALSTTLMLCKQNPSCVFILLPLLLYILKSNRHKNVKVAILHSFPNMASDKTVLPSILKVILSLSDCFELLPVCIMLLTTLWMAQRRIYNYLLQLLNRKQKKETMSLEYRIELLFAQVSSILQICKLAPTQHGEDMIVLISNIMEDTIKESESDTIANNFSSCIALLIEGLKSLCLSDVVDVRSIWKFVTSKLVGLNDSTVTRSLCSLLSCFPLQCKEDSSMLNEVVTYLWSLVTHSHVAVVGAAYKALSAFPVKHMKVNFLPGKSLEEVCKQLEALKEHKDDEEYKAEEEELPGFGYMMLLHETNLDALPGFQYFIDAALEFEVSNLPRGLGLRSFARPVPSLYNQIPSMLQIQYESSNRPAVLPGVASGLLCCFEPKITNQNISNNAHAKQLMGRYRMMLDNLLQEFNIRQNDWHQAVLAPRSWIHFMTKVYDAYIKGRIADLSIKEEKGEIDDKEGLKEEIEFAKFWARDEITNQLRKASKSTPKLQGNSMFALVGLLNAVVSYEDEEEIKVAAPDEYISTRTWTLKVADTVMTVFDGNIKLKGKPFQWCQQVSSEKSTASSTLSRCCAAVALSDLVQPLLSIDTFRLLQMVQALKKASLGSANSGSVTQFHLYCFIGWGLLLSRLSQEQFTELSGNEGKNAILSSLDTFENIVFHDEASVHPGPIIGYGLAISSLLAHATQKDSKVHALLSYEKILSKVTSFTKEDTAFIQSQAFCYVLACTTLNAFNGGCISATDVMSCAEMLHEKMQKDCQSSDLHIALGVLCYTLLISNSKQVSEFLGNIVEKWVQMLGSSDSPLLAKLGCIKGITSACGIDLLIFKLRDPDKFEEIPQLKEAVKFIQKLLVSSKDNAISYLAAQSVGQIYLINQVRNLGENSSIPQNYNYLKEKSLLRSIFNELSSAVSFGPHSDWNNIVVYSLISALNSLQDCRLPPVNWTVVLNPVLRIGYNLDVKKKCIQFAIKFVKISSSLTRSITSWIQPNTFLNMEDELQKEFFESAPLYLSSLSNSEQRGLLEILPLTCFNHKNHRQAVGAEFLKSILGLWSSVLQMQCPVQSSLAYIMSGMDKFIDILSSFPEDAIISGCLAEFAKCLLLVMKDSWPDGIKKLHCHPRLACLLRIEILRFTSCIQGDDLVKLIVDVLQVSDDQIHTHLLKTLLHLDATQYDKSTMNRAISLLIGHERINKDSVNYFNIMILLLMVFEPVDWIVLPYNTICIESNNKSLFSLARSLLRFTLPKQLSPDNIAKVQKFLCHEVK